MIEQVLTDSGQVVQWFDTDGRESLRIANARMLKHLRGMQGAAGNNNLGACTRVHRAAIDFVFDARRASVVESDASHQRMADKFHVAAFQRDGCRQ